VGGKPDDDVRQAILAPAAAGVIAPTGEDDSPTLGRYEVVANIGRGGMGEVYLARKKDADPEADFVALKVLVDEDGRDQELIGMFMDEASIMAQIHHPNVLAVYDFGRARGSYFLAMEYLSGRPLVRVMIDAYTRDGGMDSRVIAAIGADAARGLYAAHSAVSKTGQPLAVVHRDVSPQNIFVTYRGVSKVIDFGVARASERVSRTNHGQLKGKAAYMSPEQINGKVVDGRSDVFSLGICLWEMAAGRRLFKRSTDYDTMAAVLQGEVHPPSAFRPEVDRALDDIILAALERNPKRRMVDAGLLSERLETFAKTRGLATDGTGVARLLDSMYSQVAAEERALIRMLQDRAGTEAEINSLRELSGIAPRGDLRMEVTLAARPAALSDLDDFGTLQGDVPRPMGLHIDDDPAVTERAATPGRVPETPMPPAPNPTERAEAIRKAVMALQAEHAAVSSSAPQPRLSIAKPKRAPRRGGELLPYLGLIAIFLSIVAIVLLLSRHEVDAPPIPALAPKTEVEAPAPPPAVVVADTPAGGAEAQTVVPQLVDQGFDIVNLGDKIVIDDGGNDGPITVAQSARFVRVLGGGASGWLVLSEYPGAPSVAWIGALGGGRWRARGVSVNDCPANARVQPTGVELMYGDRRVQLPHGGGPLETIRLTPPSFATRLEVEPLGLAFGAPEQDRSAVACSAGWAQGTVVLERMPPGKYTLQWLGDGRVDSAPLVVRESVPNRPNRKPIKKRRKRKKRGR